MFHIGALQSGTRLPGGGVHPIMVYSGQVPPERGTFSRIHSVYERVGILLVELYFWSLKRLKKGNRLINVFHMAVKLSINRFGFIFYSYFEIV